MKTGGWKTDLEERSVHIAARLWPLNLELKNRQGEDRLNPQGTFLTLDANNSFVGMLPDEKKLTGTTST